MWFVLLVRVSGLAAPASKCSGGTVRNNGCADVERSRLGLRAWLRTSALAVGLVAASASAENELSALGDKGFDASLIDGECVTSRCSVAAKSCLDSKDCLKGMTCTAKCLGDNACITGCFAKYGTSEMNELLECTVERHGCIKIAILEPGPYETAPAPPLPPLRKFDPKSLRGTWYKVLGWNSRYDCFDCQRNSFKDATADRLDVNVEFSMPRPPRGPGGLDSSYPLKLTESLVFDRQAPTERNARSVGHLFGLTFWENWSVLGENKPGQPEWKFVYYTGKTTQNTYEGAFVYSRQRDLPRASREAVFDLARKAGLDPASFCVIKNDCETCDGDLGVLPARQPRLFVGAATAAEDPDADDLLDPRPRPREGGGMASFFTDLADYLEDPRATANWLFSQQRHVGNTPDY
ncbi:hypothetical protein CTAYLR_001774 [Chrysophaeum taylorii]|uniref:VDE lipocalin domain-containing protein n=1 Tax=Chrysophaeum taylorii TaxID=2483200 RepID=A0AAD7XMC9_9STRA|nr:hypothetical protein CTAYLR_001774 [Chrysophaeum taylorii]